MTGFLKLDQAASRVARLTGNTEFTADDLVDLAMQERLGLCFTYHGDIAATWEHSPDGESKEVGSIPFRGIVKMMQPPTNDQEISEFGVLVSLLRTDALRIRTGQVYRLPVPKPYRGYITKGYEVVGFIEDANIPRSEWWVQDSDVSWIVEASAPTVKAWPWGDRTTKLLDLLAQTANQWWSDYDPKKPQTAPKSESIEEWLSNKGVSQKIAAAMATILRPDGLKPGPRKN